MVVFDTAVPRRETRLLMNSLSHASCMQQSSYSVHGGQVLLRQHIRSWISLMMSVMDDGYAQLYLKSSHDARTPSSPSDDALMIISARSAYENDVLVSSLAVDFKYHCLGGHHSLVRIA